MNEKIALCNLLKDLKILDNSFDPVLLENRSECVILALSRMGYLDEQQALNLLSKELNLTALDLEDPSIKEKLQVRELIAKCDENDLWKAKIVPLWEEDDFLVTGVANPFSKDGIDGLRLLFSKPAKVVLLEEVKINQLLGQGSFMSQVQFDNLESLDAVTGMEVLSEPSRDKDERAINVETPPIIKLCNKILGDAVSAGASDIHVEPKQHGLELRFRIDGVLHSILDIPKRLQSHTVARFKLLAGMNLAEKRRPQDGIIRVKINGTATDIRVSAIPAALGEKLAMRVLVQDSSNFALSDLGIPEKIEKRILAALAQQGKMFLVTGPTGSGKSTSLYGCLNFLADGTRNIETVEDPVEYHIPKVNQVQVNEAIDVTFASCLRSILRQDPDVIMIGEIRDSETAKIALQAAQTGHLVLSSLHTNDAPSAITRLYDLGVEPFMVASSLAGVMAQRLLRKICPDCIGAVPNHKLVEWQDILSQLKIDPDLLREGSGCKSCNGTGYKGRTGIYSLLDVTEKISALIHERASTAAIVEEAKQDGYESLTDAAKNLLMSGVTSLEEARPYLRDKANIRDQAEKEISVPGREGSKDGEKIVSDRPDKVRVLLIEDDQNVREIMSCLLEEEMYEVIQAENGQDGLEKLFSAPPDVVLCDLMMPRMDGKEFLIRLKNNKDVKSIPLIFLTAVDSEENEADLINLGAFDFISKSAGTKVLLSRIRNALSHDRSE